MIVNVVVEVELGLRDEVLVDLRAGGHADDHAGDEDDEVG